MDFTLNMCSRLLKAIILEGYNFQPFEEFIQNPLPKVVILRHDVDKKPNNSLKVARIEAMLGIRGTYYCRIIPEAFDANMIKEIKNLGHEIGYHYEDLALCNGDCEKALQHFEISLNELRKYYPIRTICMHGSPRSRYNNLDLWNNYNYQDYGIIGEPYIDINFNEVFYITDTGRCWDGYKVSIRDRVKNRYAFPIHTTNDFIRYIELGKLPRQIMMTMHPQRWEDNFIVWTKELAWQNIKNVVKRLYIAKSAVTS